MEAVVPVEDEKNEGEKHEVEVESLDEPEMTNMEDQEVKNEVEKENPSTQEKKNDEETQKEPENEITEDITVEKRFDFNPQQIELFEKLKEEYGGRISDTILAVVVCQKKTLIKCRKTCLEILFLIKEYDFGKIKTKRRYLRFFSNEAFLFIPHLHSLSGLKYLTVTPLNLMKDPEYNRKEAINFFVFAMHFALSSYPKVSKDGVVAILDLSNTGLKTVKFLDTTFIKTLHSILKKLPLRPQKVLVYKPPALFSWILSIIKPFMSKKIASRFEIVKHEKVLLEHIGKENLLPRYNGEAEYDLKENTKLMLPHFAHEIEEHFEKLKKKN